MKIALDVDGVLLDTMGRFCEMYNIINKDNKTKDDITRFGFSEDWGMSEKGFWNIFTLCKVGNNIKSINKNAPKYIKKLYKKHDIDIVTARQETDSLTILNNLYKIGIFKDIHYNKLILSLCDDIPSKAYLGYDLYIDDNPNQADDIKAIQRFSDKTLLLWEQPWNWRVVSELGVQRVTGWKDIMRWFKNNNL